MKSPVRQEPRPLLGVTGAGSSSNHDSHTVAYRRGQAGAHAGWPRLPCLGWAGAPCWLTQAPWLRWVGGHIWEPHFSSSLSNLGFTKEKPANAVWSMESIRFLSL